MNGVNTAIGNKLTSIPLVGWAARGGMPVQLTLNHNSKSAHNSELGQKWTHSLDIYLIIVDDDYSTGATIHWGNDLSYFFTKSGSNYTAPAGIHDTLVYNSGSASYDLTTKDQIKYHFTQPNNSGYYCTTISDTNSNSITLAYNASNYVTTVTDPNSRVLTLGYTSSKISSVTDPLSRVWSISYTRSGAGKPVSPQNIRESLGQNPRDSGETRLSGHSGAKFLLLLLARQTIRLRL